MILTIPNKNDFVAKFLNQLARINNSCALHLKDDALTGLVATPDASVILNAKYKFGNVYNEENKFNIPDLGKLIRVLECLPDEGVNLKINSNNISYDEKKGVKFKYHLLEDGILSSPAINIEKVKALQYDTTINVKNTDITNLIKSASFATETDKLYLRTENGKVYGELTDKNKSNVDSIEVELSQSYTGSDIDQPIAINFEIIRIVSHKFPEVTIKVNISLGVLLFELNNSSVELIYVASGLAET